MTFTHLQVHSGYTLLDSTITIDRLVQKASELKFDALSLTDHEVLYGVIPFYKTCLKYNIKPIIGMTIYLEGSHDQRNRCILLAKNNEGYKHLIQLSTLINRDHHKVDLSMLQPYGENLICILPVVSNPISTILIDEQYEKAKDELEHWLETFPNENFYLGVQDHGLATEQSLLGKIKRFHEIYNINSVAIHDVRYLTADEYVAFDCLQAIKSNRRWDLDHVDNKVKNRHLRTKEEMERLFKDHWPELIQNTEKIKSACNVSLEFHQSFMPTFPTPENLTASDYLKEICWKYMKIRYENITDEILGRLNYELEMIQQMGFSDYFLIVWDFVNFAKENQILVGPGRGSAAGSIVAYILGITNVDPIKYGLLFERFLNPERISMPDIDIDFADHRRDEVIDYVRNKYGNEYVAQIITFGTFGARSLLRELFKIMEIDNQDMNYIFNIIPSYGHLKIIDYIQKSKELKQYIKQSKRLRVLFKIALTLEGLPRHISTHAAGIIMSKKPLMEHVPLTEGTGDTYLTQFPMEDLESLGLLKMDFLGLRNLTFIEQITKSIFYKTRVEISLDHIPLNDKKTFSLLQEGKTNGIFQLESQGMRRVLQNLKPTHFEDIVAVNALYRPGPMDYIQTYIQRKRKDEAISYPHPDLKPILEKTYGVLIYQEQIIQIAHKMANFTFGEADVFRRAISKKEKGTLVEKKKQFIEGCLRNGYDQHVAEQLFLWIEKFSSYGFNRSHAVAYSKISYQLAYLKANYPIYFYAELLNANRHRREKIYEYIKEVRQANITVLPPSINKSYGRFSVEDHSIRIGLLAVKGLNHNIISKIIDERKNGRFKSLFDFCLRLPTDIISRKTLELLILTGTFDELNHNRASLLASIDQAIEQAELFGSQASFLAEQLGMKEEYVEIDDFSQMQKLNDEKELLGIYISDHPLKKHRKLLQHNGYESLINANNKINQNNVKSAVIIQEVKKIRTKRGDPMAFIVIGDETNEMEAVVFPDLYREGYKLLNEEMIVFITGKISLRNNRVQWVLSSLKPFDEELLEQPLRRVFIKLAHNKYDDALSIIKRISQKYPGNTPVYIYHEMSKKTYKLSNQYNVDPCDECIYEFIQHFGKEGVAT